MGDTTDPTQSSDLGLAKPGDRPSKAAGPASRASRKPVQVQLPQSLPDHPTGDEVCDGPATDVVSLADESHVVMWSRGLQARESAANRAYAQLHAVGDSQVVSLPGAVIHDLKQLRDQVNRALPDDDGRRLGPSLDGPAGLLARLAHLPRTGADGHHIKFRYYLWRDADVLLKHSPPAFSMMVDAVAGVAAEAEFASDDLLLIQRLILVGGPELHRCYHDPHGPLRAWRPGSPWKVKTGQPEPRFMLVEVK
jgi:hypothetical protein